MSFFFIINILGLILSILGFKKSKGLDGAGRGLSLAGIIISVIGILFFIGLVISSDDTSLTDVGSTRTSQEETSNVQEEQEAQENQEELSGDVDSSDLTLIPNDSDSEANAETEAYEAELDRLASEEVYENAKGIYLQFKEEDDYNRSIINEDNLEEILAKARPLKLGVLSDLSEALDCDITDQNFGAFEYSFENDDYKDFKSNYEIFCILS